MQELYPREEEGGEREREKEREGVPLAPHSQLKSLWKWDTDSSTVRLMETEEGRPLPPSTASSSLLPPAPSPPPAPLHPVPPTIRECQVPLLDSSSSHTMLEPHPEDQISPNSYLLRAQPPTGAPNHHSQSTLRPPIPPPHNHQTLSHHQSSANSLNRNTLSGRRNPIHAPPSAPGEGPTTPESVQLQDSWVLNSNVPLETSHQDYPAALSLPSAETEPHSPHQSKPHQARKPAQTLAPLLVPLLAGPAPLTAAF
ncbi:hypothetical protein QQF64_034704 [Cirrhinus molitorella]|uniref:Teneurin N-terminal domain-containing protein n=1 Tax=Cirrhinus molitorella TaxID=172907 RepID=A0ABR3L250_9TELE